MLAKVSLARVNKNTEVYNVIYMVNMLLAKDI